MEDKIYILYCYSGYTYDISTWIAGVFNDINLAEKYQSKLELKVQEITKKYKGIHIVELTDDEYEDYKNNERYTEQFTTEIKEYIINETKEI